MPAIAGKLVKEGRIQYLDFFYPQSPLLPNILALIIGITGPSWYYLRLFYALCALAIGAILYLHIRWNFNKENALTAVILFSSSTLTLPWLTVIKTYAPSLLLLMVSFLYLANSFRHTKFACFLSGLSFGLAVTIRIYLIILLPIYIAWSFIYKRNAQENLPIAPLLIGFFIGTIPIIYNWHCYPQQFVFDNFTYHSYRSYSNLSIYLQFTSKFKSLAWMLGGSLADSNSEGLEFLLLLIPSIWLLFHFLRKPSFLSPSVLITFALIFASLLPSPIHPQYFCLVIPFLIINLFEWLQVSGHVARGHSWLHKKTNLFIIFSVCLGLNLICFYKYAYNGEGVSGVLSTKDAYNWRIPTISKVSEKIEALTAPAEQVLSWWPGYFLETHSIPLLRFENQFSLGSWNEISMYDRKKLGLFSLQEVTDAITNIQTRLIVLGNWNFTKSQSEQEMLVASYEQIDSIGDTKFYINKR